MDKNYLFAENLSKTPTILHVFLEFYPKNLLIRPRKVALKQNSTSLDLGIDQKNLQIIYQWLLTKRWLKKAGHLNPNWLEIKYQILSQIVMTCDWSFITVFGFVCYDCNWQLRDSLPPPGWWPFLVWCPIFSLSLLALFPIGGPATSVPLK